MGSISAGPAARLVLLGQVRPTAYREDREDHDDREEYPGIMSFAGLANFANIVMNS
jgi:hypothetical protein